MAMASMLPQPNHPSLHQKHQQQTPPMGRTLAERFRAPSMLPLLSPFYTQQMAATVSVAHQSQCQSPKQQQHQQQICPNSNINNNSNMNEYRRTKSNNGNGNGDNKNAKSTVAKTPSNSTIRFEAQPQYRQKPLLLLTSPSGPAPEPHQPSHCQPPRQRDFGRSIIPLNQPPQSQPIQQQSVQAQAPLAALALGRRATAPISTSRQNSIDEKHQIPGIRISPPQQQHQQQKQRQGQEAIAVANASARGLVRDSRSRQASIDAEAVEALLNYSERSVLKHVTEAFIPAATATASNAAAVATAPNFAVNAAQTGDLMASDRNRRSRGVDHQRKPSETAETETITIATGETMVQKEKISNINTGDVDVECCDDSPKYQWKVLDY